jgi:CheY-like chemotaxis protein
MGLLNGLFFVEQFHKSLQQILTFPSNQLSTHLKIHGKWWDKMAHYIHDLHEKSLNAADGNQNDVSSVVVMEQIQLFVQDFHKHFTLPLDFHLGNSDQNLTLNCKPKLISDLLWSGIFFSRHPFYERASIKIEALENPSGLLLACKIESSTLLKKESFHPLYQENIFKTYFPDVSVRWEMKPNHGEEILFTIKPLSLSEDKQHQAQVATVNQSMKSTVLLAEDQDAIRHLLREVLEEEGYLVLTAKNVYEVLSIFNQKRNKIDLLITDIIMPEMNGPDLMRHIYKMGRKVRTLYISGHEPEEVTKLFTIHDPPEIKVNFDFNFLKKPFKTEEILDRVKRILLEKNPEP